MTGERRSNVGKEKEIKQAPEIFLAPTVGGVACNRRQYLLDSDLWQCAGF
jgi:hypothetical protein